MITALIGHRGVGKTALLKRPEILFSRREDVIHLAAPADQYYGMNR